MATTAKNSDPKRSARHAAFLRGINVGGKNKVSMTTLRELFEELGATDVQTHLNSGNVVYAAPTNSAAAKLARGAEDALEKQTGRHIGIVTRSHAELERIINSDPFPGADPSRSLVAFLSAPITANAVSKLEAVESGEDEFVADGSELYLHCPTGINQSKLALAVSKPGGLGKDVVATARNWRTVTKLCELTAKGS